VNVRSLETAVYQIRPITGISASSNYKGVIADFYLIFSLALLATEISKRSERIHDSDT